MPRAFQVLLSGKALAPEYRWRLVDGFFAHIRAPIEGCGAIAIVATMCLLQSHDRRFAAVAFASLIVLMVRVLHSRLYAALRRGGAMNGTPERWAWQFFAWSAATSLMWPALNVLALLSRNGMMQIFVITVQSGWLGGACTRNAASPATVLVQAVLVLLPAIPCMAFGRDPFMLALIPFAAIQFSATLGISRRVGAHITETLISQQNLELANGKLIRLSATDGLTGIANRRAFDDALQAEWTRAVREATDVSLLLIDVDNFKLFNDRYGHPAGDDCLRTIAGIVAQSVLRPSDLAARFGGEEFVALLPGAGSAGAFDVGERLRQAVVSAALAHEASAIGRVTVSIGAASVTPGPGADPMALVALADRALYAAKRGGRNRVCTATAVALPGMVGGGVDVAAG